MGNCHPKRIQRASKVETRKRFRIRQIKILFAIVTKEEKNSETQSFLSKCLNTLFKSNRFVEIC